nr:hypothetical protein CFP56_47302 [Quercus suber]
MLHELTTHRRIATMKENKGKDLAAGYKVVQSGDELDTSNLSSCRGNKRPKLDSLMPSTTLVMVLDPIAFDQPPVVSKVDASLPPSSGLSK